MTDIFKNIVILIFATCSPWICVQALGKGAVNNHEYVAVKIGYATSELTACSFAYSPINFCDDDHVSAYKSVIKTGSPNFNGHYILFVYPERRDYHQRSVVAIDVETGFVYPLPIDAFSGYMHGTSVARDYGKISYSLGSNRVCVGGAILVYRSFEEGNFCFDFVGDKFVGHHTEYMYP